jgi:hypothetical protein
VSYFTGGGTIGKRIKCSTKRLLRDGEWVTGGVKMRKSERVEVTELGEKVVDT